MPFQEDYTQYSTPDGAIYFYNAVTGDSIWADAHASLRSRNKEAQSLAEFTAWIDSASEAQKAMMNAAAARIARAANKAKIQKTGESIASVQAPVTAAIEERRRRQAGQRGFHRKLHAGAENELLGTTVMLLPEASVLAAVREAEVAMEAKVADLQWYLNDAEGEIGAITGRIAEIKAKSAEAAKSASRTGFFSGLRKHKDLTNLRRLQADLEHAEGLKAELQLKRGEIESGKSADKHGKAIQPVPSAGAQTISYGDVIAETCHDYDKKPSGASIPLIELQVEGAGNEAQNHSGKTALIEHITGPLCPYVAEDAPAGTPSEHDLGMLALDIFIKKATNLASRYDHVAGFPVEGSSVSFVRLATVLHSYNEELGARAAHDDYSDLAKFVLSENRIKVQGVDHLWVIAVGSKGISPGTQLNLEVPLSNFADQSFASNFNANQSLYEKSVALSHQLLTQYRGGGSNHIVSRHVMAVLSLFFYQAIVFCSSELKEASGKKMDDAASKNAFVLLPKTPINDLIRVGLSEGCRTKLYAIYYYYLATPSADQAGTRQQPLGCGSAAEASAKLKELFDAYTYVAAEKPAPGSEFSSIAYYIKWAFEPLADGAANVYVGETAQQYGTGIDGSRARGGYGPFSGSGKPLPVVCYEVFDSPDGGTPCKEPVIVLENRPESGMAMFGQAHDPAKRRTAANEAGQAQLARAQTLSMAVPPPPLPKPTSGENAHWKSIVDPESGSTYYWNEASGDSQWAQPTGPGVVITSVA